MSAVVRKSKRDEIIRCFTEMIAERGYDEVSVRDVAEALQISKGTVLHHFRSKEALLEELHSDYMRRRIAEAEALLGRFPDPVDQLQVIVYQLMIAQRDDRAATVAFAREIVRFGSEDVMADVREMRDRYSEMVTDVIRRGIEAGAFEGVDPRLAALQLFGMCNWSWTWFKPEGRLSAIEIAGQYCRVLLGGLMREAPAGLGGETIAAAVVETMSAGEVAAPAGA